MEEITVFHNSTINCVKEIIAQHKIETDKMKRDFAIAINSFYDKLRKQEEELRLLAADELDENMVHNFIFDVIEHYYSKYEEFLDYCMN